MKHPRAKLLWAAAALVLAVAGCNRSGGGDQNVIRIGEYASLTGSEATFGTSSHEGTLLAIEQINAAGGVLGKKLKLFTEDTRSRAGDSATAVNRLIARDDVVAILGEVASGRSLEAAPICQANQIPMISPASTNPKVTEAGDYIFRVCFTDRFQGGVDASFALKTLKAKRVALFTDEKSDYSIGLGKYFQERFVQGGGQIVAHLDYDGGDKDFKAQLTSIKAAQPDAVFVPGYYTEVALICMQARELGLTVPFFGGDGWESDKLLKIGGPALEGDYFSTHFSPDAGGELTRKFVESYRKRWDGRTPDTMAALGYDSALVLADAIRRAGSTAGPKIRDAIAATKNFQGVTGSITINAHRNATKSAVILQVHNGRFKYLETIQP